LQVFVFPIAAFLPVILCQPIVNEERLEPTRDYINAEEQNRVRIDELTNENAVLRQQLLAMTAELMMYREPSVTPHNSSAVRRSDDDFGEVPILGHVDQDRRLQLRCAETLDVGGKEVVTSVTSYACHTDLHVTGESNGLVLNFSSLGQVVDLKISATGSSLISFDVLENITGNLCMESATTTIVFPQLKAIQGTLSSRLCTSTIAAINIKNSGVSFLEFPLLRRVGTENRSQSGTVEVKSNSQLENLSCPRLVKMWGDLDVSENENLRWLYFPLMQHIGGILNIADNTILKEVYFTSLLHCQYMEVRANRQLTKADFPELNSSLDVMMESNDLLTSAHFPKLPETTRVRFTSNTAMTSLDFNLLSKAQHVSLDRNEGLETINFSSLVGPLLSLEILDNQALVEADFPRLDSTQVLEVRSNKEMTKLSFKELTSTGTSTNTDATTGCNVRLVSNTRLTTVFLPSLEISNCVEVSSSQSLTALDLPSFSVGGMVITNNSDLISVTLPSLAGTGNEKDIQVEGNNALQTVEFPMIVALIGNVYISKNPELGTLDARSLNSVSGDLMITTNRALTSADFRNLAQVGGFMEVSATHRWVNIEFPLLGTIGEDLTFKNNGAMETLVCPNLLWVSGTLDVRNNYVVTRVDFSSLRQVVHGLSLVENNALTTTKMESLFRVGGDFEMSYNVAMKHATFESLRIADGLMLVDRNSQLTSIDMGALVSVAKSLQILEHNKLVSIEMSAVEEINGDFQLTENVALTSVGLNALRHVKGTMSFVSNTALINLDLPLLASVDNNVELSNNGLRTLHLNAMLQVGGSVDIQDNDELCLSHTMNQIALNAAGHVDLVTLQKCWCPSGSYRESEDATQCLDCNVGYYCIGGDISATQCRAFSSSLARADAPEQCICDMGHSPDEVSKECVICGVGRVASKGDLACTECSPGKFSSLTGQSACLSCEDGYFTDASGSAQCSWCLNTNLAWMMPSDPTKETCIFPMAYVSAAMGYFVACLCAVLLLPGIFRSQNPLTDITLEENWSSQGESTLVVTLKRAHWMGKIMNARAYVSFSKTGIASLDSEWYRRDPLDTGGFKVSSIYQAFDEVRNKPAGTNAAQIGRAALKKGATIMTGKKFTTRVLTGHKLEIMTAGAVPITSSFFETSRGNMHLNFPWTLGTTIPFLGGLPVGIVELTMLGCMVVTNVMEPLAVPLLLILTSIAVFFSCVFFLLRSGRTPLQAGLGRYTKLLTRRLPNPVKCERGPLRGVAAGIVWEMFTEFQEFIRQRNMYYLVGNVVKPLTLRRRLSFSELVGSQELRWFVSHFWGTSFQEFVNSVRRHANAQEGDLWSEVPYWICSLSNNQWEIGLELGEGQWEASSFYKALRSPSTQGTAMVLDPEALPLTRAWCLFEVVQTYQLNDTKHGFAGLHFCTSTGTMHDGNASVEVAMQIAHRLASLRLEEAQATNEDDKRIIWGLIEDMPGGFDSINAFLRENVTNALVAMKGAVDNKFAALFLELEEAGQRPQKLGLGKDESGMAPGFLVNDNFREDDPDAGYDEDSGLDCCQIELKQRFRI